jgi:hypothetical protein
MIGRMFPPQGYGVEDEPYTYYIFIDDDGYIKAKNGKTGRIDFSGTDLATVLQNVIDSLPNYNYPWDPQPVIAFQPDYRFSLNSTVTIPKKLKIENAHLIINTSPAFVVFNGNTSNQLPEDVVFENCFIHGNNNDVFFFRYCQDWQLRHVTIWSAKRAVMLERTWGDNQLMLGCHMYGNPPDGEGVVEAVTPQNGQTNGLHIIGGVYSCGNPNASCFHFAPQASPDFVAGVHFTNVYIGENCRAITGRIGEAYITDMIIASGSLPGIELDYAKGLYINDLTAQLIVKGGERIYVSNIRGLGGDPSKPMIDIQNCRWVHINGNCTLAWPSTNQDVPFIRIGIGNFMEWIKISHIHFEWFSTKAVIELNGPRSYSVKIEDCVFRNINGVSQYPTCYILYSYNTVGMLVNCYFHELRNITAIANDLTKFKFIGTRYGDYLFEKYDIATIPANSTRVTVSHGLYTTPTRVLLTPTANIKVWVENITSTTFDIVTDTAPTSNVNVMWHARVE